MDELLQQVADKTGIPADMLERAAQARAEAEGTIAEAIVAGWAGTAVPDSAPAGPEATPAAPVGADVSAVPVAVTGDEVGAPPAQIAQEISVEVFEAEPESSDEAPDQEDIEPERIPVAPGMPRWVGAAFVVVPFIAILYALIVPNGPDCGNAGRLEVDPVTGTAVNCDGSEYGSVSVNYFSIGEAVYEANCTACHGATGGGGVGPGLAGGAVAATFSSCNDHIEWVRLGSAGWAASTYGDTNKPKVGGMPAWGNSLTAEELAAVVFVERVAFGNLDLEGTEDSCGLNGAVEALSR